MPLKEAWKWLFGRKLAERVNKQLDSGAVAPLLVTVNIEYPDDLQVWMSLLLRFKYYAASAKLILKTFT